MVLPVSRMTFRIGTNGRASNDGDMVTIRDMESFSINFDNGVEQWSPLDEGGWTRRLTTAKSITISLSGKRNYLDRGNNYAASLAYETGHECNTVFDVAFPNGHTMRMNCVVNVTETDGGGATDIASLDMEILSDGRPEYFLP